MEFTPEYLASLKAEHASQATDSQFSLWIEECKMRGLVPVRDVVLQIRGVKEWDQEAKSKVFKKKAIYITTIQALRKLAERTGKYAGQLPSRWIYLAADGTPSIESEIPLPEINSTQIVRTPWAAKASVLRKGFDQPMTVPARFEAYAQYFTSGDQQVLNSTWSNRGPEQLEKCAEALALRKAFPEELGGLYLEEEIKDEATVQAIVQAEPVPEPLEPKKSRAKKSVHKTDEPVQANQPERGETVTAKAEVSPNIHGLDITDQDLPDNLRAIPAVAVPEVDQKPSKEEKADIKKRLDSYSVPLTDIGSFIKKKYGLSSSSDLTFKQWSEIFSTLDSAKGNTDELKKILGGK